MAECTAIDLATNSACYQEKIVDSHKRLAIQVYALMLTAAATGGTDYTDDISGLIQAACAWKQMDTGTLTGSKRDAAFTAILLQNATAAGATVPDSLQATLAAVACLSALDHDTLDAVWYSLFCALPSPVTPV